MKTPPNNIYFDFMELKKISGCKITVFQKSYLNITCCVCLLGIKTGMSSMYSEVYQ